jgi:hypothetical protein
MNHARLIVLLTLAYLAVFFQAAFEAPQRWLGGPVSLVPPLMVCAALRQGLAAVTVLALCASLWLDALSANPLGSSLLPLFLAGWGVWHWREALLRELDYAQLILGALASLCVPVLTLVLVLSRGAEPDLGWHTVWQLVVLTVGGGVCTPILFRLLEWLERLFVHPEVVAGSFRPDREIKRGRY